MKAKFIALALICTSSISVFAGCSESDIVSTPKTTDRTDITFVANYDNENKDINTTLTNDTEDEIILYKTEYQLYKKLEEDKWKIIKFDYESAGEANYLFTDEGLNSADIDFSAYNTASENMNPDKEFKNGGLEAGEYKITMTFDVYPESEASTIPHKENETISVDNPDGKYLNAAKAKHEEVTVGADFTVK